MIDINNDSSSFTISDNINSLTNNKNQKTVFISYSSVDRSDALEIVHILRKEGCNVWFDAFDIRLSENLEEELFNNIKKADVLCILLSPSSVISPWVTKEIEYALTEHSQRGLKILVIILRACEIPDQIKGITALSIYDTYEGLKSGYIRLKLVKAVVGSDRVTEIEIDEALQKSLGDRAKQEKAAEILPELSYDILSRIRDKPINDLRITLDPTLFYPPTFITDPFVLELRLEFSGVLGLWNQPMSFFFAKFHEGKTWPVEFNFEEPSYVEFGFRYARIDAKFRWYNYVQDLIQSGSLIESVDEPATYTIKLDGSEYEPPAPKNKYHPNIPSPRKNLQIPPLQELIDNKCEFFLIEHHPLTRTAKKIDLKQTDIDLQVSSSFFVDSGYINCTLFRSRHDQFENIILAGSYLSDIQNPIAREAVLGCYPYKDKKIEARTAKLMEVHNMLLLDPSEITWSKDRQLIARLIYSRLILANFRRRELHLFDWEDVPGEGNISIRDFLKEDFRRKEHFAYLMYNSEDEIERAQIKKSSEGDAIFITAKDNMTITLRSSTQYGRVEVLIDNGQGKEVILYYFGLTNEDTGSWQIFLTDVYNVIQYSKRIMELMKPVVFNSSQPTFDDGFLIFEACIIPVSIYISQKAFDYAAKYVNNISLVANRMIETDPAEPEYVRWIATGFKYLADIELGQNKTSVAMQYLANNIEIFHNLYKTFPNKARMEDLILSLEYRLKIAEGITNQIWAPIEVWKKELTELNEKKNRMENFLSCAVINMSNLDKVQQIADSVQLIDWIDSSGTKKRRYIRLIPKRGFDYDNWEHMNNSLTANGYYWVTFSRLSKDALGSHFQEKGWEKSIYITEGRY
jgi:hypothetical protein